VRLRHYQAFDPLRAGKLMLLLQDFEPEPAPVHLMHLPRSQMPLKMRRFLDFAAPRLRKSLTAISAAKGPSL
jgi:DNA-binding transcriptional LysR family regulator